MEHNRVEGRERMDEFAHDRVPIRFHRIGRAIAVGLVGAFGWGVRGIFGHELGAAIPGALIGGLVAMLSGHDIFRNRQWAASATAAVASAVGGSMSYGLLIGYTRHVQLGSVVYGFLGLLLVGALWGMICGALLGLALARGLTTQRAALGAISMLVAAGVSYAVLVLLLGLHLSPPRSDAWAAVLGAAIALGLLLRRWNVPAANGGAVFGGLGFGLGFVLGNAVQILGNVSGIPFDWWKAMEMTMGFCGGAALAWGIWLMGDLSKPIVRNPNLADSEYAVGWRLLSWAVIFFWIPVGILLTRLNSAELHSLARQLNVEGVSAFVAVRRWWAWGLVLLGLTTVRWPLVHSFEKRRWTSAFPFALAVQVFMLAYLKAGLPVSGKPTALVFGVLAIVLVAAIILVSILEPTARVFHLHPPAPTLRFVGKLAVLALVVTILVAWLTTLLHSSPLPGAHLRW